MALDLMNNDYDKLEYAMAKYDLVDYYEYCLYRKRNNYYEYLALNKNKNG